MERRFFTSLPVSRGPTPQPVGKYTSLEHELYLNLQRLALSLSHDVSELFKRHGLSAPQFNILRILRGAAQNGEDGLACSEIGERLLAQAPDLTRLLDRMAAQGLVTRERGSRDRRVVTTHITEKGLSVLSGLDVPLAELHAQQFEHLNKDQLKTLNALLSAACPPKGDPR